MDESASTKSAATLPVATVMRRPLWRALSSETSAFWLLVALYLLPIWAFHYLPTQDGPSHLYNARIIKEYGGSAAGYEAFFELRNEPLPNLTSHLLLAALLYLLPPLLAEKVLVSLYVVGFAGAFRYFLGAFGTRCRPLSWAGLLFVYNRCFWMGFYNYCLSVALLWFILGYCLRRRATLSLPQAAALMLLFTAEFFTHLIGFFLAGAGALAIAVLAPPRRLVTPILIALAALPPTCLALDYFDRTGFFQSRSALRIVDYPKARLSGYRTETTFSQDLAALDSELFEYHAGADLPFGLLLLPYCALLVAFQVSGGRAPSNGARPGWYFPALFGLFALIGYLLVPNHLGFDHGGFLKARLAMLPPLAWLACLREPARPVQQLIARGAVVFLLVVNLALVADTIDAGNQAVAQYTAGIEAVGSGHRLFVIQPDLRQRPLVDPLLHAADYYCLVNDNVNLDNYEASTPHFPLKFRTGVQRGKGNWAGYGDQAAVDVILCWHASLGTRGPPGWDKIVSTGPLHIYRRLKE
jgi:hypothetical protein